MCPDSSLVPGRALDAGGAAVGEAGAGALHVSTPRSVTAVPMLRRRARAWLQARGVDEDVADAVLLATGEAVSNAVEHAYPPDTEGVVELTMTAGTADRPTEVDVAVTDGGRWRPAPADAGFRGRGLQMIRALAQRVEISTGAHGTCGRMSWH